MTDLSTIDWRALCAELVDELDFQSSHHSAIDLKARARAALAQPEPSARRPKPPSLKEKALEMLERVPTHDSDGRWYGLDLSLIRHALEQLDDD
jgi:hypothetical protein